MLPPNTEAVGGPWLVSPYGLAPGLVEAAIAGLFKNREGVRCASNVDSPSLSGGDLKDREKSDDRPGEFWVQILTAKENTQ